MDSYRDFPRLKGLVLRLCETLGKPPTDELIESWWKALRHVDFESVAERVDQFIAKADDRTKFPRPAQMRPENAVPPVDVNAVRNHTRDYWRTCVVNEVRKCFGVSWNELESMISDNAETLGASLRKVMDDLCEQEQRDGRTGGQQRACHRWCADIAREFAHLHPHHQHATSRAA